MALCVMQRARAGSLRDSRPGPALQENALIRNKYRDTILSSLVRFSAKRMNRRTGSHFWLLCALLLACGNGLILQATAQDWVKTGTSLGVEKVRLAVPDFKPSSNDPQNAQLQKTFNDTLWNDLDVSGVVELVSKSFYPLQVPGQPMEVNFIAWNAPPPNAAMLAFGNLGVTSG